MIPSQQVGGITLDTLMLREAHRLPSGAQVVKWSLIILNVLAIIAALLPLIFGALATQNLGKLNEVRNVTVNMLSGNLTKSEVDDMFPLKWVQNVAWSVVGVNSFLILLSLMAIIGALFQFKLLLKIFAIILILLIIVEVVLMLLVGTHGKTTLEHFVEKVEERTRTGNHTSSYCQVFDNIQKELQCCGVNGTSLDDGNTARCSDAEDPAHARDLLDCRTANLPCVDAIWNKLNDVFVTKFYIATGILIFMQIVSVALALYLDSVIPET